MIGPPHPGQAIGDNLRRLRVSQSTAAKALGIARKQLQSVIGGRGRVNARLAVKLEMAVGGSAEGWMQMQTDYDIAQARKRTFKIKRLVPA